MTTQTKALKLALSRLEWFIDAYPHDITTSKEEFLQPFKEALAQPEQEPVAWVVESEEYNAEGERPILREIDYYNQVIDQFPAGTKLYTTQPQRKPLTDEFLRRLHHVDEFGLFCDYDDFEQIARAIEAAHGIKGEA